MSSAAPFLEGRRLGPPDAEQVARISARALELAQAFYEQGREEIARLAEGDTGVLYAAAQRVRTRVTSGRPAASPEHLAFSLLVAANELLRHPPPARLGRPIEH